MKIPGSTTELKEAFVPEKNDAEWLMRSYKEMNQTVEAKIESYNSDIAHYSRAIIENTNAISEYQEHIERHKSKIEELEKLEKPDYKKVKKDIIKQFALISNNPMVESVDIIKQGEGSRGTDRYIRVITKPLTYHSNRKGNEPFEFELGQYMFFIRADHFRIVNMTYTANGYHHPCVDGGASPCFGGNVQTEIFKYLQEGNYAAAVFLAINFLQEPNYGRPYIQDDIWLRERQEIKRKFDNDFQRLRQDSVFRNGAIRENEENVSSPSSEMLRQATLSPDQMRRALERLVGGEVNS